MRLLQLAREPLCRFCAAFGRVTAATVVDHIQTIASAPELRLVASNHRSLCKPCHDSHTASTVGFGRTKAAKAKVKGCDADGYPLSGWQ